MDVEGWEDACRASFISIVPQIPCHTSAGQFR
jgi:hypothetical protein